MGGRFKAQGNFSPIHSKHTRIAPWSRFGGRYFHAGKKAKLHQSV